MSSVSSYLHFSVTLSGAYYTCPFLLRDSVCSGSCITHSLSKDECFLRLKCRCILIAPEAHSHSQHMINTCCSTFSQPALPASSFSSYVFPLLHSFLLMGEKIDSKGMKWPEDLPLLPGIFLLHKPALLRQAWVKEITRFRMAVLFEESAKINCFTPISKSSFNGLCSCFICVLYMQLLQIIFGSRCGKSKQSDIWGHLATTSV